MLAWHITKQQYIYTEEFITVKVPLKSFFLRKFKTGASVTASFFCMVSNPEPEFVNFEGAHESIPGLFKSLKMDDTRPGVPTYSCLKEKSFFNENLTQSIIVNGYVCVGRPSIYVLKLF